MRKRNKRKTQKTEEGQFPPTPKMNLRDTYFYELGKKDERTHMLFESLRELRAKLMEGTPEEQFVLRRAHFATTAQSSTVKHTLGGTKPFMLRKPVPSTPRIRG